MTVDQHHHHGPRGRKGGEVSFYSLNADGFVAAQLQRQPVIQAMLHYDPEQTPNAAEWLALGEQERIALATKFHRAARIKLPNVKMHATIHAIVENQIAEGHETVVRAITRLTSTGLSRHDAIHAIGSILAERIFDLLHDIAADDDLMVNYDAAVERLTAESWRRG